MEPFLTDIARDGVWASTMEPSLTDSVRDGCRESGSSAYSMSMSPERASAGSSTGDRGSAILEDPRSRNVVDGCFVAAGSDKSTNLESS